MVVAGDRCGSERPQYTAGSDVRLVAGARPLYTDDTEMVHIDQRTHS